MTSLARQSPSGPLVDLETTTDLLDNVSTVPGSSATDALRFVGSPGAGGGGGIPIAGTAFDGGASGTTPVFPTAVRGGTTSGDKNGGNGQDMIDALLEGGAAGGGASSSDGTNAGNGGRGGFPSGPGGGGGASAGGGNSGAGGAGGGALIVVITEIE